MVDESFRQREVVLLNWIYLTIVTFTVKSNNMVVECHMLVSCYVSSFSQIPGLDS